MKSKITILGQPRSGSVYIRQNFYEIFGESNVKAGHHTISNPNVITIRDPRDSIISLAQTQKFNFNSLKTEKDINKFIKNNYVLKTIDVIEKYINDDKILILRYEDFFQNNNFLLDAIEKFFGITINEIKRKEIEDKTSMENNIKIQKTFKVFEEWDRKSGIHGNHINGGEIGKWKNIINKDLQTYYSKELEKYLKILKY